MGEREGGKGEEKGELQDWGGEGAYKKKAWANRDRKGWWGWRKGKEGKERDEMGTERECVSGEGLDKGGRG